MLKIFDVQNLHKEQQKCQKISRPICSTCMTVVTNIVYAALFIYSVLSMMNLFRKRTEEWASFIKLDADAFIHKCGVHKSPVSLRKMFISYKSCWVLNLCIRRLNTVWTLILVYLEWVTVNHGLHLRLHSLIISVAHILVKQLWNSRKNAKQFKWTQIKQQLSIKGRVSVCLQYLKSCIGCAVSPFTHHFDV